MIELKRVKLKNMRESVLFARTIILLLSPINEAPRKMMGKSKGMETLNFGWIRSFIATKLLRTRNTYWSS